MDAGFKALDLRLKQTDFVFCFGKYTDRPGLKVDAIDADMGKASLIPADGDDL